MQIDDPLYILMYMTEFSLSKAAARVVYVDLETKGDGFTIKQLRLLDKTLSSLDIFIGNYNKKIEDRMNEAREEIKKDHSKENIESVNFQVNIDLDELTNTEGKQLVTIQIEDEQFKFIKEIIDNMQGFKGDKTSREILLEIGNALDSAKEINQTAKKNENEPGGASGSSGTPAGDSAN